MHRKFCCMRLYPSRLLETVVPDVTRDVTALFLAIMDVVSHIHVVLSISAGGSAQKVAQFGRQSEQGAVCLRIWFAFFYTNIQNTNHLRRVAAVCYSIQHSVPRLPCVQLCGCKGDLHSVKYSFPRPHKQSPHWRMLPRVSDCAFGLRLLPKQKMTRRTAYVLRPEISLLRCTTQKHVNFEVNVKYCNKMRGVSVFATNFVRKIFCPDLLWGPSSLLFNGYRNKDKAAVAWSWCITFI